jgi:hypothetical protein
MLGPKREILGVALCGRSGLLKIIVHPGRCSIVYPYGKRVDVTRFCTRGEVKLSLSSSSRGVQFWRLFLSLSQKPGYIMKQSWLFCKKIGALAQLGNPHQLPKTSPNLSINRIQRL